MNMINIKVRKEVVRCLKCKKPKDFIYLSDFSYGERLVFANNGLTCAFISLIEDKTYDKYEELVKKILQVSFIELDSNKVNRLIKETFGITCDEINEQNIDFSQNQQKCSYCGSIQFEKNMIEPESFIKMEIPLISHEKWNVLSEGKKEKLVKDVLMLKLRDKGWNAGK